MLDIILERVHAVTSTGN